MTLMFTLYTFLALANEIINPEGRGQEVWLIITITLLTAANFLVNSKGVWLFCLGGLLIAVVIHANGGYMPIERSMYSELNGPEMVVDLKHNQKLGEKWKLVDDGEGNLLFLSDNILIRTPTHAAVYCIGDFFVYAGLVLLWFEIAQILSKEVDEIVKKNRLKTIQTSPYRW